jgi:drug/metabolite transporter (DMT)-like permease
LEPVSPLLGLTLAIASAVFFGVYILPRKRSESDAFAFQVYLSPPIPLLFGLYLMVAPAGAPLSASSSAWCALAGAMWVLGAIAYSVSVDLVGITRSTPVKNIGPLLSTLFGIVLFREFTLGDPLSLTMAVAGSACMGFAAVLIGRCAAPDEDVQSVDSRQLLLGFGLALLAGVMFGAYAVPLKIVLNEGVAAAQAMFVMGLTIPVASVVTYAAWSRRLLPPRPSRREFWRCQAAGAAWVGGGGASVAAMEQIPMAVVWPITNLSALVTVGFGVWMYREVNLSRHRGDLTWGTWVYVAGVLLLGGALARG